MPSFELPAEFTDADGHVLVKIDEGGAILQYRADGSKMTEIWEGIQHFNAAEVRYAQTTHHGTAHFDSAGNRIVDVMLDGGVTVWRGTDPSGGQAYAQVWSGGVTTYDDQGNVTGQLP